MDRLAIVSTDGHAGPLVEEYRDYLEASFHPALDALVEEEKEYLDATLRISAFSEAQLDVIDGDGAIASGGFEGAWELGRRLEEMDREGVAAEVFLQGHQFASAPFFGGQNRAHPQELRMAGVRAYNRWQADMLADAGGRLIGVAEQTPVRDIEEVVREARWAGERGFRGITFSGISDPSVPQPPFHDPYWEPLWRACADHQLALVLHVGFGTPQGTTFDFFVARAKEAAAAPTHEFNRDRVDAGAGNMMEAGEDATTKAFRALNYSPRQLLWELMVGGVFDRYPMLNFVPTEARADWVPATLAHMDARYDRGDTPLKKRPSAYWASNGFAGASFIHRAEIEDRHAIGVGNLMFGRDYPHPEGTWPNTLDWLRAAFAGVPENEARMILSGNAIRCYGLDAAEIKALADRFGPRADEVLGDHQVDPLMVKEFDKRGGFTKPAEPLDTSRLDEIMNAALVG